jgi:hypothetical protein
VRICLSNKFLLLLCIFMLASCATYAPYPFAQEEKRATITFFTIGKASMCKAGKIYNFSIIDGTNFAAVPAGERITIGTFMHFPEYAVSYKCFPMQSVIPIEGEKYVLHNYIRDDKCFLEIVREDSTAETGIRNEPSIGARDCDCYVSDNKPKTIF